MSAQNKHPYHLVDPSPWPAVGAMSALFLFGGAVLAMHNYAAGTYALILGALGIMYTMYRWWKDVVREAEHEGHHTPVVQLHHRYGMAMFIASEVMFFAAFFWAFFDASLFADGGHQLKVGTDQMAQQFLREQANAGIWPPKNMVVFDAWDLPFLNTLILLMSGVTVTWAHHALREGNRRDTIRGLAITVVLGLCFTALQAVEYLHAPFPFRAGFGDAGELVKGGIYSSTFYLATGFHGFHVIIGTIFLIVCLARTIKGHFTPTHHFGFEAAAWYWHFVDVVWLFLFFAIYLWGAGSAPSH